MHDHSAPATSSSGADQNSEEEAALPPEHRAAMETAATMRREGASRPAAIEHLTAAGIKPGTAEVIVDHFDLTNGILHDERPGDIDDSVKAKIDDMLATAPALKKPALTKPIEELANHAQSMAVQGKSREAVVTYLTDSGVSRDEANRFAAKVTMDVRIAQTRFDESKRKAIRSAQWRIGLGALAMLVGLILMASGAETSGRRTPLGAFLAGGVIIASGIKELSDAQNQNFRSRVREVYGR